jgi:hypothetical protein
LKKRRCSKAAAETTVVLPALKKRRCSKAAAETKPTPVTIPTPSYREVPTVVDLKMFSSNTIIIR